MAFYYVLDGVIDPSGDEYDPEEPTKQQEILALELRRILYGFQEAEAYLALPGEYAGELEDHIVAMSDYIYEVGESIKALRQALVNTEIVDELPVETTTGDSIAAVADKLQLILEEQEQQESIIQIGEGAVWTRSKAVDQW